MHDTDPLSAVLAQRLDAAIAERLRALPSHEAEPYGWEVFRQRAEIRSAARRARVVASRAVAATLTLAAAAAGAAWMWGGASTPAGVPVATGPSASSSEVVTAAGSTRKRGLAETPAREGGLAEASAGEGAEPLSAAALAAERWLESQPSEPAVVRVGAYAAVARLEDRIAQLDDLMTAARAQGLQPASLSAMTDQRNRLVSNLAQVRYAESLVAQSPR